jgi:hypothetical protein
MRLLRSYIEFMTVARPIIRSSARAHMCACGSHQLTNTLVTEFTGPE